MTPLKSLTNITRSDSTPLWGNGGQRPGSLPRAGVPTSPREHGLPLLQSHWGASVTGVECSVPLLPSPPGWYSGSPGCQVTPCCALVSVPLSSEGLAPASCAHSWLARSRSVPVCPLALRATPDCTCLRRGLQVAQASQASAAPRSPHPDPPSVECPCGEEPEPHSQVPPVGHSLLPGGAPQLPGAVRSPSPPCPHGSAQGVSRRTEGHPLLLIQREQAPATGCLSESSGH